jgi:hypothetical protein
LDQKRPIIISTHSINFVENFNFTKKRTLSLIARLIKEIKVISPEIEFINEGILFENYKNNNIGKNHHFFIK